MVQWVPLLLILEFYAGETGYVVGGWKNILWCSHITTEDMMWNTLEESEWGGAETAGGGRGSS